MSVVVSGLMWMGSGIGSIETAVEQMLAAAKTDVVVVTYAITPGAATFFRCLEQCLGRGVRIVVVANRMDAQNRIALAELGRLVRSFPNFSVYDFNDPAQGELHAKFILIDRSRALVGSANLSWNGMVANHELAIIVEDSGTVGWIAEAADRLFRAHGLTRLSSDSMGVLNGLA